jgi:phenylacetate-CoA ligase
MRTQQSKELIHHVKAVVGVTVRVNVVDPGAIDRSLGKAKRVLDMRPRE